MQRQTHSKDSRWFVAGIPRILARSKGHARCWHVKASQGQQVGVWLLGHDGKQMLLWVCDRLESQLVASQTENNRLVKSVLHHALFPFQGDILAQKAV
jgi:hypothetical protein